MKDRLGSIIYVGKARDLKKRMSSYFMASQKMRASLKTRALIDSIHDFEFHTVRNEEESLLLEGKLIKDYRPRYNVAFPRRQALPAGAHPAGGSVAAVSPPA
jgi:excinuclease ABC subunit C